MDQLDMYKYFEYPQTTVPEMVKEFARVTDQQPDEIMSASLIDEEYLEWAKITGMHDHEHELKELSDLIYVIYGYARVMGWDLDEAVRRVHTNNLGRCVQPDGSVKRRSDGKIMKNKAYTQVDLKGLV